MLISVVAPIYNEEENVPVFCQQVQDALNGTYEFELILIDDGSTDRSASIIQALCEQDERIKMVKLRRNFGQTAALTAGIDHSQGDIVVLLDADLQNDPSDIPHFIEKINEGYDTVIGRRKKRKDSFITKKVPSFVANLLIRSLTNVKSRDLGCTLKAFRRDLVREVRLYGEMHRFIPIYTDSIGAKMIEIDTNHRKRLHGNSKYGLKKSIKVALDLITIIFFSRFSTRPMHFFGAFGVLCLALGLISTTVLLITYSSTIGSVLTQPLFIVAIVFVIVSMLFFLMGVLAEVIMRTYYEAQSKKPYYVRETLNVKA